MIKTFSDLSNFFAYFRIFSERQDGRTNWSYVRGPNRGPLLTLTLGQLLQKAADSHGDETAAVFVHQNIRKSFHQTLVEVKKEKKII